MGFIIMGTLVFVWELGGGYGHVSPFIPVMLRLLNRGHKVACIVKSLLFADKLLRPYAIPFFQSPLMVSPSPPQSIVYNYAGILDGIGYSNKLLLSSTAKAWRNLFDVLLPDLLIADHAPTALLVARGLSLRRALFGTGFCSPPRVKPLPSLQPWAMVPESTMAKVEASVLKSINYTLDQLSFPRLAQVADLFHVDENFLCSFPELDHYQNRKSARYWGASLGRPLGIPPCWPDGEGKRLFAYIKADYPLINELLTQLNSICQRTIVHLPGAPAALIRDHSSPFLRFSHEPVEIMQVTRECDLVISHAGHGMTSLVLLSGIPMLLLPTHPESTLLAQSVVRLGAGLAVIPGTDRIDFRQLVFRLLTEDVFRKSAIRFASKYAQYDYDARDEAIADRCEQLISSSC